MANLHFHYGVMSSSKSAALLINAYNFRKNGIKIELIKPSKDVRFSCDTIDSRIGLSDTALALPDFKEYVPGTDTKVSNPVLGKWSVNVPYFK